MKTDIIRVTPSLRTSFEPSRWNSFDILFGTNCLAFALDAPELGIPYTDSFRLRDGERFLSPQDVFPQISENNELQENNDLSLEWMLRCGMVQIKSPVSSSQHTIGWHPDMGHFFNVSAGSHKEGDCEATNRDHSDRIIHDLSQAKFFRKPNALPFRKGRFDMSDLIYLEMPKTGVFVERSPAY